MVWGALAGMGISGVGGAIAGHQATKRRRLDRRRSMDWFNQQIMPALMGGYSTQLGSLDDLERMIGEGYGKAKAEYGRIGDAASRQIGDQRTRDEGAINSMMARRGFGNTTTAANASRAAGGDESRRRQDLASMMAGHFGGLEKEKTGALANVGSARTNLLGQRTSDITSMKQAQLQAFMGGGSGAGSTASSFGAGIGSFMPYFMQGMQDMDWSKMFGGGGADMSGIQGAMANSPYTMQQYGPGF